ncbi:c-type cytochrome [Roseomonas sp. NAR14]|uniref:C-type cytochrome n=2 Tax=Roseomonas acroporae TaxID=2937791 RepID=A0A9X1Y4K6_9PROT|nr:c-type cytochrome [Roseomonas acroporae]
MRVRIAGPLLALACAWGAPPAAAQPAPGAAATPDGATLFRRQCMACHSVNAGDPPRQGPNLAGVFGRKPGSVTGFRYSAGYAAADFVWDEAHLDSYLANPQAVIPGSVMAYRQNNPATRQVIIAWLKEQN